MHHSSGGGYTGSASHRGPVTTDPRAQRLLDSSQHLDADDDPPREFTSEPNFSQAQKLLMGIALFIVVIGVPLALLLT